MPRFVFKVVWVLDTSDDPDHDKSREFIQWRTLDTSGYTGVPEENTIRIISGQKLTMRKPVITALCGIWDKYCLFSIYTENEKEVKAFYKGHRLKLIDTRPADTHTAYLYTIIEKA